jgi:hypothetical protein
MAKGRKSGGKDFAPGCAPGPGRPPLPPELKAVRRLTKAEFETLINKYLWMDLSELEAATKSKALPAAEAYAVSIIASGIKSGNWSGFEWIAQRLLGKVQDKVEVTTPKPYVIEKLDGSQVVLGAKVEESE